MHYMWGRKKREIIQHEETYPLETRVCPCGVTTVDIENHICWRCKCVVPRGSSVH